MPLVDVRLDVAATVEVATPDEAQTFRERLQERLDAAVALVEAHGGVWRKDACVWLAVVREEEEATLID